MAEPEELVEWLNKAEEDRLVVEVLMQTGEHYRDNAFAIRDELLARIKRLP